MITRQIDVPIYGFKVHLVANCTHRRYAAWLARSFKGATTGPQEGANGRFEMITYKRTGTQRFIIWLESFNWTIPEQAMAAHEIWHLTAAALRYFGIENEEAGAYLFQHVMAAIWRELKPLWTGGAKGKR